MDLHSDEWVCILNGSLIGVFPLTIGSLRAGSLRAAYSQPAVRPRGVGGTRRQPKVHIRLAELR